MQTHCGSPYQAGRGAANVNHSCDTWPAYLYLARLHRSAVPHGHNPISCCKTVNIINLPWTERTEAVSLHSAGVRSHLSPGHLTQAISCQETPFFITGPQQRKKKRGRHFDPAPRGLHTAMLLIRQPTSCYYDVGSLTDSCMLQLCVRTDLRGMGTIPAISERGSDRRQSLADSRCFIPDRAIPVSVNQRISRCRVQETSYTRHRHHGHHVLGLIHCSLHR